MTNGPGAKRKGKYRNWFQKMLPGDFLKRAAMQRRGCVEGTPPPMEIIFISFYKFQEHLILQSHQLLFLLILHH